MTNALTFRALSALPAGLQELARQHVERHPCDCIDDLIGELAVALAELRGAAAEVIYNRARSRLRRATQDPAHHSAPLDIERHDVEQQDDEAEPSAARRRDIVREIAQQRRVSVRRAQQLVKSQIERAMQGDLFIADEIAGGAV